MGEKRSALGVPSENEFEADCCSCFDECRLELTPSPLMAPKSWKVGDVGEREPLGVGDRTILCVAWTGEPSSMPDMADGGRYSGCVSEKLPACPLSTQGESGSAGERSEREVDFVRSKASAPWSLMLAVLPLRLWPDCDTLPFLPWDFCGVPLGLAGVFHVTLDGVPGREDGREDGDARGWYAGPDSGDMGLRRPMTGESGTSEVGEDAFAAFRWRSSGVLRPFIERLKKRGAVEPCPGETGRLL